MSVTAIQELTVDVTAVGPFAPETAVLCGTLHLPPECRARSSCAGRAVRTTGATGSSTPYRATALPNT